MNWQRNQSGRYILTKVKESEKKMYIFFVITIAIIIYVIGSAIGILVASKIMDMQTTNAEKEIRKIYQEIHNGEIREGKGKSKRKK